MKKETLTDKLIKRTYGISGPLDEHKTARGRSYRESSLYCSLLSDDIWQPHPLCPGL